MTVALANGDLHRFQNADRDAGSHMHAEHAYSVGRAGELHIVPRLRYESQGRISLSDQVLRSYAPGAWLSAEGDLRADISDVDPSHNLATT